MDRDKSWGNMLIVCAIVGFVALGAVEWMMAKKTGEQWSTFEVVAGGVIFGGMLLMGVRLRRPSRSTPPKKKS